MALLTISIAQEHFLIANKYMTSCFNTFYCEMLIQNSKFNVKNKHIVLEK